LAGNLSILAVWAVAALAVHQGLIQAHHATQVDA
jgi:hypothetical protein